MKNLRSRKTIDGPSKAPHRAMYKAMGLNDENLNRPIVGVSSTCNEATPVIFVLVSLHSTPRKG